MIVRQCGDNALLVDVGDLRTVMALHAGMEALVRRGDVEFVDELVPAAATLLVLTNRPTTPQELEKVLPKARAAGRQAASRAHSTVVIEVDYSEGIDLEHTARQVDMSPAELIDWHTSTTWVAAFGGFAPGFMYLTAHNPDRSLRVPRRQSPRTEVPAGSVALADAFSAVYPRRSPGGWQIIGRTNEQLWNASEKQPALISPGDEVRFAAVSAS